MSYTLLTEDYNFNGVYRVKETADIEITSLNYNPTWLGAENKSVLDHLNKLAAKVYALDENADYYRGDIDCAANPNYPAAEIGDWYRCSGTGKIGGASGKIVESGDRIQCIVDNAGGDEAAVGASWTIFNKNIEPCDLATLQAGTELYEYMTPKIFKDAGFILSAAGVIELEMASILLDGDTSINAAHTFATGTGNVSLNGTTTVATTKALAMGTATAIGGTFTIYRDGAGTKALEVVPATSMVVNETTTFTPQSNVSAITITGTNVTTGNLITVNPTALTTGAIMNLGTMTTKKSGAIFGGSMTTATLDFSAVLDSFNVSCNSDGLGADTHRMHQRTWSGAMPNGTANADLIIYNAIYSGTIGNGGAQGGFVRGLNIDFTAATANGSAVDIYGAYISTVGLTRTSANSVYGLYIAVDSTDTAAAYLSDGTRTLSLCNGTNAITTSYSIAGGTLNLTPTSNLAPLTLTGTSVTTANLIELASLASTTGGIINIGAITTKTSGSLYSGSMTTSTLDATTVLDSFTVSCAHDGVGSDTLGMISRTWSGAMPNGTASSNLIIYNAVYSGTIGNGGAQGGYVRGLNVDFTGATVNGSAVNIYAGYISTQGLTRASANSVYGLYVAVDSTDNAGIYVYDGTRTIALCDGTNAITTAYSIAGGSTTLTPISDISAITITGTNIAAGHLITLTPSALTTGSLINIAAITTKTSGYLYNGSMTTSTLDASTLLDDFSVSCAHDGIGADTLRMIRRTWSGAMPNGTASSDFVIFEGILSSTVGNGGATGGTVKGLNIDFTGATLNGSTINAYGIYSSTVGLTRTSANTVYAIYAASDSTDTATIYATDGTRTVALCDGTNAVTTTLSVAAGTLDLTPASNIDAIDITGTNMTTAYAIDIQLAAKTSGTIINVTSGTSAFDAGVSVENYAIGNAHDGAAADELIGSNYYWTGAMPQTSADANLSLYNAKFSAAIGSGAAQGGLLTLYKADFNGATLNGSAVDAIAFYASSTGITNTSSDELVTLKSVGTWDAGIVLAGTYTTGIDLTAGTITPDASRTNSLFAIGDRLGEKDITMVASANYHLDPVQFNLNIIGVAPTSATINTIYSNITHDTTDMPALRLKCADWNIAVAKNVQDVYVYQGEVDFTGTTTVAGEACAMGLTVTSATATSGYVWGGIIVMSGAGIPAATSACLKLDARSSAVVTHGLYLECASGATMTNAIYLNDAGTVTNLINVVGAPTVFANFDGCTGVNGTIATQSGTEPGTWAGRIRVVMPDGTTNWIKTWSVSNEA